MKPVLFFASVVVLYTAWQAFPNGPLAFYVTCGLWIAWVSFLMGWHQRGDWWPASLFGVALGVMHAGCGMAYVGDGRSFVCDAGTGLPITPLVLAVGVGIATYYAKRQHGRATS